MNAIVLIFVAHLALHLSSVRGDMLVRSQTYNISATAVDKHGRVIKVRGSMIDFKLLYIEPEGQANNDFISFNIAVNEQDGTNADVYKLDSAFPMSNSPSATSANKVPKNSTRRNSRPSASSSALRPAEQHEPAATSIDSEPTAKFDTAPLLSLFNPSPKAPSFPSSKNPGQAQSSDQEKELPSQGSPLSKPQPYPSSSGAQSSNSVPAQTFQTSKQHPCANPPIQNVFDRNNPETRQQGGPRVDDTMVMPPHQPASSLGGAQDMQSQVGGDQFKVKNVSITPTNGMMSMNLVPVRGQPWTSENKDGFAQVYENAPNVDLRSPLRNISVVSSNNGTSTTNTYTTLDAASLLEELEPVNKKVVGGLVDDFLVNEMSATMSPSDVAMMKDIVQEVDRIMNDQPPLNMSQAEIHFVPVGENMSTETVTTRQQPTTVPESTTSKLTILKNFYSTRKREQKYLMFK
jgi:hypothetical protein